MAGKKNSGLGQVVQAGADYGGDLLEPMAMLAAGASKASVAWTAFRNVWVTKVLGPVGMLSGAAAGAIVGIAKMSKAFADMGMRGAAGLETLTTAFKPLLKGIESAKARMAELSRFAAATPFKMNQVAEASKTLEVLTKGALSTAKGLTLVGDAAAVTGRDFNEMAVWVGRLYDGLMSGRPIGEVAQQLQAVGVISGATRNQSEALLEQGKAGNEVWQVAERETSRASGAMKDMSKTLDGLQSTLEDNKNLLQASFSKNFLEGEKAGVEATAKAYEKLTPVVELLGRNLAVVSNLWDKTKAGFTTNVTVPLLDKLGPAIAAIGSSAIGGVAIATVMKLGKVVTGAFGASTGAVNAAAAYGQVGQSALGAWDALKKLVMGQTAAAGAAGTNAVALARQGAAGLRTAGIMGVLAGGLKAAGAAALWLGRSLAAAFSAALLNWPVMLMTALTAAVVVWWNYNAAQKAAVEQIKAMNQATREQVALLQSNLAAVKTAADINQHYTNVLTKLTAARLGLMQAERAAAANPDDPQGGKVVKAAQANVAALEKERDAAARVRPDALQRGSDEDSEGAKAAREKTNRLRARSDEMARSSPEVRARMMAEDAEEARAKARAADDREKNKRTSGKPKMLGDIAAQKELIANQEREMAELDKQIEETSTAPTFAEGLAMQAMQNPEDFETAGTRAKAALQAHRGKLGGELGGSRAVLGGMQAELDKIKPAANEIEALDDLVEMLDEYAAAKNRVASASEAVSAADKETADAKDEDKGIARNKADQARAELGLARSRQQALDASVAGASPGMTGLDAGYFDRASKSGAYAELRQAADERRQFIKGDQAEARDQAGGKAADAANEALALERSNQDAALEAREAEVGMMAEGIDKANELLEIERGRLLVQLERGALSVDQYDAAVAELDTQEKRAKKEEDRSATTAALDLREQELETMAEGEAKLEKQMEIERERAELIENPERRAEALAAIDEEEKQARGRLSRSAEASRLEASDAASPYRGAERELRMIGSDRKRLEMDFAGGGMSEEQKAARAAEIDQREREIIRNSNRSAARGMLGANIDASQTREGELERNGAPRQALRERRRRMADERKLAMMDIEDQSESIADPEKRKQFIQQSKDAFDEMQKADIATSKDRQQSVNDAAEAYGKWIEAERARIQAMMRVSAQMAQTQARMVRWTMDNSDELERAGIIGEQDKEKMLAKAQGLEEAAAQKEDAIKFDELARGYMEGGYSNEQAQSLAKRQIDADRAERGQGYREEKLEQKMERLSELQGMDMSATAVSSMKSIGGGTGGAYGPDSTLDLQKETNALLNEIKGLLAEPVPLLEQQEPLRPYSS